MFVGEVWFLVVVWFLWEREVREDWDGNMLGFPLLVKGELFGSSENVSVDVVVALKVGSECERLTLWYLSVGVCWCDLAGALNRGESGAKMNGELCR